VSTPAITPPTGVKPIRGPSAIGGASARRFLTLTWTLAVTEFRLKFFGSVLGYLWQLMRPLLLFSVLYVVFSEFVEIGAGVVHYPAVLLTGLMINMFWAEATGVAVASVLNRENLVRKIHFPRLVIPLSVVVTAFMNFCLNFIAVFVFYAIQGVELQASWLQLIPIVGLLLVLCTGVAMAVSALYVRYRDVQPIWDVILPVSFYATPILYPIEAIPESVQSLVMCNPLAVIVVQARHALIDPTAPTAAEAIGGTGMLMIPLAIVAAIFVFGYWTFNRSAPKIAEEM
jgi:ABC-2 type transport system permease protein